MTRLVRDAPHLFPEGRHRETFYVPAWRTDHEGGPGFLLPWHGASTRSAAWSNIGRSFGGLSRKRLYARGIRVVKVEPKVVG